MSEYHVFITRRIPEQGVRLLEAGGCHVSIWDGNDVIPREELLRGVKGKDALLCLLTDIVDVEVIREAGEKLKVISTLSVGYEHIDTEECKRRGIAVTNTPNVSTDSVAELTVALLLLTARRLLEGCNAVKKGEWGKWKPMWLCGTELTMKTVGILGLGRIGFGVGKRLRPFGIKRLIYNDVTKVSCANEIDAEFVEFEELITDSDIICICCGLNQKTKHLFNKDTFGKMKSSSILINSGRGGIINHEDLQSALTSGEIAAAGLDVTEPEPLPFDHPLVDLKNCIILPHMGSNTLESRNSMSEIAAQNILDVLHGKVAKGQI